MTTCIFIIGIIGTWCAQNAAPIGICHPVDGAIYCTVELEDVPARASWYNPILGGTNCFEDTCETLGDGTPTSEGYGRYMACPLGMYGETVTFSNDIGTWQCRDHGTAVTPKWGRWYTAQGFVWQWVITFDFLLEDVEWFTYGIYDFEVQ